MAVVLRFSLPFTWDTKDTGTARHHPSGMRHGRAAPASPLAGPLGKLVVFYPRHSVRAVGALEEGQRLQQIVRRGKHGSIRVRRAMIIVASASGTPVPAIARLVAADEDTVRDVMHAFNEKGLAALDPHWAGGRPRLISDDDVEFIVTAATTRPEKLGLPFTRWSLRKLAGLSGRQRHPGGADRAGAAAADPAASGRSPSSEPAPGKNPPIPIRTPSWTGSST